MVRKTREEAWKTREKLLLAAQELFGKYGFDKTNLSDIAISADVTRGAVYWHFQNKDELFIELWKYLSKSEENYYENFQKIEIIQSSPISQLRNWLLGFKFFLLNDRNLTFCKMIDSISRSATASTRIKNMVHQQYMVFIEKIASFLVAGVKSGELPENLNIDMAKIHVFAVVEGYFVSLIHNYSNNLLDHAEDIIELIIRDIQTMRIDTPLGVESR